MQFRDLKTQYETLKPSIDAAIAGVIANTSFISGPPVKELEKRLADYVGRKYCITCGNGTDALSLALMAWKIGPGDAVFVPDFTFFATAEVVSFEGATPVLVDVDEETFNMNPQKLREAVEAVLDEGRLCPRAVIPVDLFGLPADYPSIEPIAAHYGLKILEDAAQGFGGSIGERMACSFGTCPLPLFSRQSRLAVMETAALFSRMMMRRPDIWNPSAFMAKALISMKTSASAGIPGWTHCRRPSWDPSSGPLRNMSLIR